MADSAEENINIMTSTWDGRGLIKMLNLLFKNSINNESPRATQPPEIKIPLRPHQQAVITAM